MATTDGADKFILFSVAGTQYGLRSRDVRHIEMVEQITPVPNAAPYVQGVVFSRGSVVPVINLRQRFGFERAPLDLRTRLLVVADDSRHIGLLVDAAREFITIPPTAIQSPHDAITGTSGRYLEGVATLGERIVLVLSLAELVKIDMPTAADVESK